jgi:hypothetical protein
MYKIILFLMLVSSSFSVFSANFHFCDCKAGADTDCVTGSDFNGNGNLNSPWQSFEKARITFNSMQAGDSVLFCQGGKWDVATSSQWVNSLCLNDNRCLISNYIANWSSGDENFPVLQRTNADHMFAFENGGNGLHEEGYEVKNLVLIGADSHVGVFFYNDIDHVLLDNLSISQFGIGVQVAESNPCDSGDPQCDGKNKYISLSNSVIFNNNTMGWLGASDESQLLNNDFYANGSIPTFHHNVYLGSGYDVGDMQVIGNSMYQSALDQNGICQGASFVVHGIFSDLLIENNTVYEDAGAAAGGCYGIAVDAAYDIGESFSNVRITGNTVKNVGNIAIGVSSCIDCVIENNVIINDQGTFLNAIAAPNRAAGNGDAETERVIIRNNSIYMSSGGGEAIVVNGEGNQGTGHVVVNNAIHYDGNANSFNCLNLTSAVTAFNEVDNNICYRPNSPSSNWEASYGSLASWQNSTGFDTNSSTSDPGFKNPANDDLSAIDQFAQMVDSGHPTLSSLSDILGQNRDSIPDIGAYEWAVDLIFINGFE